MDNEERRTRPARPGWWRHRLPKRLTGFRAAARPAGGLLAGQPPAGSPSRPVAEVVLGPFLASGWWALRAWAGVPVAAHPYRPGLNAVAALALPVLGFWAPVLGPLVTLLLVLSVVPSSGAQLWGPGRGRRRGVALLGFAAMWLPAVLAFAGWLGPRAAGAGIGSTSWLLLPLCGPEQFLAPTLAATAVYAAGAAVSGVLHRPWPWVLGALLSALSYDLVVVVLPVDFIC